MNKLEKPSHRTPADYSNLKNKEVPHNSSNRDTEKPRTTEKLTMENKGGLRRVKDVALVLQRFELQPKCLKGRKLALNLIRIAVPPNNLFERFFFFVL